MKNNGKKSDAAILRQNAEEQLKKKSGKTVSKLSEVEMLKLIHEFEVHQIELEMQNEELMMVKEKAETAANKYTALYDFAPSGYFTLLREGEIVELNHAGSQMLGKGRSQLIKSRFGFFVSDDTKPLFNIFLEKIFHTNTKESCDITLATNGNSPMYVHLTGIVSENGEQCYITLFDITDRVYVVQKGKHAEEALCENETKYSGIIEQSLDGIVITNEDGNIAVWNKSMESITGIQQSNAIGMPIWKIQSQLIPKEQATPELLDQLQSGLKNILEQKIDWPGMTREQAIVCADGTKKIIQDSSFIVKKGGTVKFGSFLRDITDRLQSTDSLRLSEERFRAIWEESFDGMRLLDANGTIVLVNNAFCNQIDKEREELEDHSLDVMYDPIEGKRILSATVNNFHKNTIVSHSEHHVTLWNERKVWFELSNSFIKLGTGQQFLLSIFRDITERKRGDEEIQKWGHIFKNIDLGVTAGSASGMKLEIMNPAFAKMHGYTVEELKTKTISEIFAPEVRAALPEKFNIIHKEGHHFFESLHIRKDGSIFPVLIDATAVKDASGNIQYRAVIVQDITERKKTEAVLIENETKLREFSEHLQTIREEERGRIAREIHDVVGQSLTGTKLEISFFAQTFTPLLPADQRAKAAKKFESIMSLIDTMIVSTRELCTDLRPVVLDRLGFVAALEWQAEEFQQKTGMTCTVNVMPHNDLEAKKEIVLFRIFQESLTNIIRHAKASHVTVTYSSHDGDNIFVVNDNGIGITTEQLENPASLGLLGLKERAISLGGVIDIQGTKGKGTTITVKIPCAVSGSQ